MPRGHTFQAKTHSDIASYIKAASVLNSALTGGSDFQENFHKSSTKTNL